MQKDINNYAYTLHSYSMPGPVSAWMGHSLPSDNVGGVRFPQILDLFQSSKIPSGCLRETSIFKIIMIDDIRDFVVKARINMVGLLDVINFIS